MGKAVLISVQPYWVFLIVARTMGWDVSDEKTVEIRKSFPKDKAWNKKSYIYCSRNRRSFRRIPKKYRPFMAMLLGRVIGEFVCDDIKTYIADDLVGAQEPDGTIRETPIAGEFAYWIPEAEATCLTYHEQLQYGNGKTLYGWHISDLVIYDQPKELGEFCIVDEKAVRNCEHRKQSYYHFTGSGYIKNGFVCNDTEDWCTKCKQKPITRPPQSWCYVEEVAT